MMQKKRVDYEQAQNCTSHTQCPCIILSICDRTGNLFMIHNLSNRRDFCVVPGLHAARKNLHFPGGVMMLYVKQA